MEKLFEIILTASLTLIGGILIFSFSRLIEKLLLEPVFELNKTRGQISFCLMFNADKFGYLDIWGKKEMDEVSDELRLLASRLMTHLSLIHGYKFLRLFSLLISRKKIINASQALIGLSNAMYKPNFDLINEKREMIKGELKIK